MWEGPSYLRWVCNPKGSERVLFLEVPKNCCPEMIWFCDIRFIRYPLSECFFFFFFFEEGGGREQFCDN